MVDSNENASSKMILDQMMADRGLTVQEQNKMHQTLGGIFSSVALRRSREDNINMLRKNWANKAKWETFSYKRKRSRKYMLEVSSVISFDCRTDLSEQEACEKRAVHAI